VKTDLPSVGNFEGVQLPGGSFGSSLAPVPGPPNEFFGLEDRGPNVESPLTTETQTNRVPNRGVEGLTLTPDGHTLVGMMQSSLQQADLEGSNAKKDTPTRIVTYNLHTHQTHEYLFLLDEPASTGVANSEITALSNNTFLIDERDSSFGDLRW
jgi:hypothetical protein